MGARSYPIWVDVTSCIYESGKSYGIKETGEQKILVGSSSSNSHELAKVLITKRFVDGIHVFKYSVDGQVIKIAKFEDKKGRPGDLIEVKTLFRSLEEGE